MTGRGDLGCTTGPEDALEEHSGRGRTGHHASSSTKNDNVAVEVPQLIDVDFNSILETPSLPGTEPQEATKDPLDSANIDLSGDFLEGLLSSELEAAIASFSGKSKLQQATDQCHDSMLNQHPEMECGMASGTTGVQSCQNVHYNSKGKKTGHQQSKRTCKAIRQFQYRRRKKLKEKQIQEEIERAKAAIESLKIKNIKLRSKQDTLTSMLKHHEESVGVLQGKTHRQETELGVDEGGENNASLTKIDPVVYTLYTDVLSSFQNTQKDCIVPLSTMLEAFFNILETVPSNFIYQRLHSQIESVINKYDRCDGDAAKQEVLEREMKDLFSKRILVLDEVADKDPEFFVSRITDGWIGDILHQITLPGSSMGASQVSILTLVRHLELSSSQISSLYSHWKIFTNFWSESAQTLRHCLSRSCNPQTVDDTEKSASGVSVDSVVNVLESHGVHGLMRQTSLIHTLSKKIDAVLKDRVLMVFGLAQNIHAVFTPIQKARLCMSQRGAPWCIHVPLMLADLSLDADRGT